MSPISDKRTEHSLLLEAAQELARRTGGVALRHFRSALAVEAKTSFQPGIDAALPSAGPLTFLGPDGAPLMRAAEAKVGYPPVTPDVTQSRRAPFPSQFFVNTDHLHRIL